MDDENRTNDGINTDNGTEMEPQQENPGTDFGEDLKEANGGKTRKKFWTKPKIIVFACLAVILVAGIAAVAMFGGTAEQVIQSAVWLAQFEDEDFEVTDDMILMYADTDPEGEERIAAMSEPYGEDETWAIYMYICGSNLEGGNADELSPVTEYLVFNERIENASAASEAFINELERFVTEIDAQGMDLPDYMYMVSAPAASSAQTETGATAPAPAGYATGNIKQITDTGVPDGVEFVIQTGGSTAWADGMINPNRSQRFVIDSDGMRRVEDNHIANMGASETLADFLTFCKNDYPADHTMLIFWDHGGGFSGFASDSIYGGDTLTLKEMQEAFSTVYEPDPDDPPFEIIGFDACLMGSAEVAESLYGFGKYLVASEEIIPGSGWDYTDIVDALNEEPHMNAAKLAQTVADTYTQLYAFENYVLMYSGVDISVTFSVVDINAAHEVYEAYSALCARVLEDCVSDISVLTALGRAADQSIKFAGSSYDIFNTIDLGVFARNLESTWPAQAGKLLDALDDAVLYHRSTSFLRGSTGLSIYFPVSVSNINGLAYYLKYIYEVCDDPDIQALYYYKLAGCLNDEMLEYVESKGYGTPKNLDASALKLVAGRDADLGDGANFSVRLSDEEISLTQKIALCLIRMEDEDSNNLGEDVRFTVDDNGMISTDFDGTWLSIDGTIFAEEVIDETDLSVKYRTEVMYNGDPSWMVIVLDKETGEFAVGGIYSQSNVETYGALAERNTTTLSTGDTLAPIYTIVGDNYAVEKRTGNSFKTNDETEISYGVLDDGEYYMCMVLSDVRGDEYDTPYIYFTVENGSVRDVQKARVVAMPVGES